MAVRKAGQRWANNTWPPWAKLVFENVAASLTPNPCTQSLVMKTQMRDRISTSKFIFIKNHASDTHIRPKDVAEIMPFPGRELGENISMLQPSPAAVVFMAHMTSQSLSTRVPSFSFYIMVTKTFSCTIQKKKKKCQCGFLFLCFQNIRFDFTEIEWIFFSQMRAVSMDTFRNTLTEMLPQPLISPLAICHHVATQPPFQVVLQHTPCNPLPGFPHSGATEPKPACGCDQRVV